MKASYVTRRAASKTHIDQIEALRRAEGTAVAVERDIMGAAQKVLAAINPLNPFDSRGIQQAVESAWLEAMTLLMRRMNALAVWSYDQAAKTLISTVPRAWWRALVPSLPVKEATVSPFGGFLPPRPPVVTGAAAPAPNDGDPCNPNFPPPPGYLCIGGLLVKIEDEPIRAGKVSGAARDRLLKKIIFPPLSEEKVSSLVFKPAPDGQNWVQRLQNLSKQITSPQGVASSLIQGIASGENVQGLNERIRSQFGLAASSAKRVARTEAKRVSLQAQAESFQAVGPLLVGYQHNAQLDQNSRPEHAALNGKVYYIDPEPGQPSVDEMVIPPGNDLLPNCRCWASPVLAPPEEMNDPAFRAQFENASKDEIPDPTVYDQWFSQADDGARKEAVGVTRYNAAQDILGYRPQWSHFVDEDGSLMTVRDLQGETPEERNERLQKVNQLFRDREDAIRSVANVGFLVR